MTRRSESLQTDGTERGGTTSSAGHPLTHLDEQGRARMVDVGAKPATARTARAQAVMFIQRSTWNLIVSGELPKGDALAVARLAGIMAAKETPRLIPLCHTVPLSSVKVDIREAAFGPNGDGDREGDGRPAVDGPAADGPSSLASRVPADRTAVVIEATARTVAQTGVEMEALTAVSVAALTLYDMCKAHDRAMTIERIALMEKTGGMRGDYRRADD